MPRLRSLLAHAGETGAEAVLATLPKLVETDQFAPRPPAVDRADERVGPYRLLRELGSGGMASVWLAERTDLLQQRRVALKLPLGAWKRAGLAERLDREREILATLEHPNIARLYDAGVAEDGQPWLALEFVEGETLDRHVERRQLDVRARLRLMLQVTRAVAYAHTQLVVHRDLKPGNILVTEACEAKLLDFGIAKLLDQGVAAETTLTQRAGRALTPDYAAPEQILGRPVGTAADVYALGVLLFELLAGQRPYRLKRDSRAALEEAIVAADAPRPSSVAPPERRRALRGDLDAIVLKALKKDPPERYASADALAEDLLSHLERRPVRARPDSAAYRLGKLVARHRLATGAAAAILLAVAAGSGVALWQARIAVAERERAEEVKTFIAELLRDANPALQGGRKLGVEELLISAGPKIDARFAERPLIRAELLTIVGTALASIDAHRESIPLFEAAVKASTEALGAVHPQTLHSRSLLVTRRRLTDPGPALLAEADAVLEAMRRESGVDPAYLANLLMQRGQMAMDEGDHARSVALAEEALRVASERIGEDKPQTLNTAVGLALAHQRAGDRERALAAAERLHRIAFDVMKLPETHPNAVDARLMLGIAQVDAGRVADGIASIEAGVRHALVHRAPTDSTIGSFRTHLARALAIGGRLDDARTQLEHALTIQRNALGTRSRRYAAAANDLGGVLLALREPAAAVAPLREAQAYFAGSADNLAAVVSARLATALAATDRLADADAAFAGVADDSGEVLLRRAQVARTAGRRDEAVALLARALETLPEAPAQQALRAEALIERGRLRLDALPDAAREDFERATAVLRSVQLLETPALREATAGARRAPRR